MNKREKVLNQSALRLWLSNRVVQYGSLLTFLIYLVLFTITMVVGENYSKVTQFIPSVAELVSVFIGIVFGFFWDRMSKKVNNDIENMNIFYALINELEDNKKPLAEIYTVTETSYIRNLLKTNVWDIYKEKLGRFSNWNIDKLTGIYHNLNILNESIKIYPSIYDYRKNDRSGITEIRDNTIKDINEWIIEIRDFYEKDMSANS